MFYKIYDATVEYLESVMDGEYIHYRSGNTITASDEKPLALIQFSDDEIFAIPSEELRKNLVDFAENFKIPKKIQENAKKALRWRAEGHKGGTSVGWNTARILARGGTIGERKIRHISKYFPRHEVDKKAEGFHVGEKGFPSPGRVAWCLAGDTLISLADGTTKTIQEIVENKLQVEVLSYNVDLDKIEAKPITNWFKNRSKSTDFIFVKEQEKSTRYRGIRVTPEHPIYTKEDGWLDAKDVNQKTVFYLNKKFNQTQHEVLLGTCLGDACITKSNDYNNLASRLTLNHCIKQEDYIIEKARLLNLDTNLLYNVSKTGYGVNGKVVSIKKSLPVLNYYRNIMYPNGKKVVSQNWLDELSNISIAFWFMDDGSYHFREGKNNQYRLHTEGFDIDSIGRISNYFNNLGWKHSVLKRENCEGFYISFSQTVTNKIAEAIAPYVCDSMLYKLPESFHNRDYKLSTVSTEYVDYLEPVNIKNVKQIERKHTGLRHGLTTKYNIEIQDNNNYFANGMLVHNCLWGGDEAWIWAKKIVEKLDKVDMNDTVNFRYIPKAERDALPDSDFGFVDGDRRLFPIVIEDDVMAAARLIGRAKGLSDNDKEAVKAKIIKIAKDKGFAIPKTWKAEMSDDLESELSENVLFSAAKDDIFDITVENKVFTLQVIEVKELQ